MREHQEITVTRSYFSLLSELHEAVSDYTPRNSPPKPPPVKAGFSYKFLTPRDQASKRVIKLVMQ